MHANHLIVVVAQDKEDAIRQADSFLGVYGDGNVWDWKEIGGRWKWGDKNVDNVLRIKDSPKRAKELINNMLSEQLREIEKCNTLLIEEMERRNIKFLSQLKPHSPPMAGFYLSNMGKLLGGYYCFDSQFFDVQYGSAHIDDERMKEILQGDGYYIVNYDLHN